jgi:hypothetical protein
MFYSSPHLSALRPWAVTRAGPEIAAAALRHKADLYIAHHPVVLPAAAQAAKAHRAKVAYDAEDFNTGIGSKGQQRATGNRVIEEFERQYLPQCSYTTAASPAIASAYVSKYGIVRPIPILNVFPLVDRPPKWRTTPMSGEPLRLYWFSQCIGSGRGLEDIVCALGLLKDCRFELHLRGEWLTGYRKEFFRAADEAGLSRESISVHRPAPPGEMVRLAAEFDIGLSVEQPIDDNRPLCITNKTFVYLLAGSALVSTEMVGQKLIIEALGPAVCCYTPGDIPKLAAGLRHWYKDRNALDVARRSAWDCATRRYNWDVEKISFLATVEGAFAPRRNVTTP